MLKIKFQCEIFSKKKLDNGEQLDTVSHTETFPVKNINNPEKLHEEVIKKHKRFHGIHRVKTFDYENASGFSTYNE